MEEHEDRSSLGYQASLFHTCGQYVESGKPGRFCLACLQSAVPLLYNGTPLL
jgi:hypothetical protein